MQLLHIVRYVWSTARAEEEDEGSTGPLLARISLFLVTDLLNILSGLDTNHFLTSQVNNMLVDTPDHASSLGGRW